MPTVTIITNGKEHRFDVPEESTLVDLAEKQKTPLLFGCREADCGVCALEVTEHPEHLSPMAMREEDFLKAMQAGPKERLGCQCIIRGDVTVTVPDW